MDSYIIVFRERNVKLSFLVLLGISLCCTIPIVAIGPSFIIWPSSSEIAAYILLILAIKSYCVQSSTKKQTKNSFVATFKIPWIISYIYIAAITLLMTSIMRFPIIYPGWSIFRLTQWFIIVPFLLFYCTKRQIRSIALGLIIGAGINAAVCVLQRMNLFMPSDLFAHLSLASGGGYWTKIALRGEMIGGESIGIYSYSRVATGFFLGISASLIISYIRSWYFKVPLISLVFIGILFTGSRTGILALAIILILLLFSRKHFSTSIVVIVTFLLAIYILFPSIQKDKVMGRFVGTSITFQDSLHGRFVRHQAVLTLPIDKLLLGSGLGNLGSCLMAYENQMATKFYRAHGYIFTYLGEIGLIGSILLSFAMFKIIRSIPYKISTISWGVILSTIFSGFTDDFMIPAASGGHLAIIVAVAFRMGFSDTKLHKKHVLFNINKENQ